MQLPVLPQPAVATVPATTSDLQFPFLDLRTEYAGIRDEVLAAVTRLLERQEFILGSEVEGFENELAIKVDARFAIGCGSGTDALLLALMACGIGAGDEVITSPFTFVATAGSIVRAGARPVFVDIDPATFNLDPEKMESAITSRTRAVIPVHLFGQAADLHAILEFATRHQLAVIEDAAQAIGATYHSKAVGTFGIASCFSFFPSKNLGAAGDAGMVTTNDESVADKLRLLRVHGSRRKYYSETIGINSRLDALQAAILRVKLRYLDDWKAARQQSALRYRAMFADANVQEVLHPPMEKPDRTHVYNQFVVQVAERDRLRAHLRADGIPTEVYYPTPLHLQPAFAGLGHKCGDFPHAESASEKTLALPISPALTQEQQAAVVDSICRFYSSKFSGDPL